MLVHDVLDFQKSKFRGETLHLSDSSHDQISYVTYSEKTCEHTKVTIIQQDSMFVNKRAFFYQHLQRFIYIPVNAQKMKLGLHSTFQMFWKNIF